jgi:hypothetical protein
LLIEVKEMKIELCDWWGWYWAFFIIELAMGMLTWSLQFGGNGMNI